MEYLSSSFSKLWNILSTKSAWRSCISLFFPARPLLYSLRYEDPCLEHWPLVLSLKSRCPSLFPFLLDSFCNLSDMKIYLWNTDLLHCPWSLVALSSRKEKRERYNETSRTMQEVSVWRSISGTLIFCIILEVSLSLSLSLTARLLLWSFWYEGPSLEHWPLALSLKSRCISLSSPSYSTPSVIFRIWSSFLEHWPLAWCLKSRCISLSFLCTTSKYYLFRNEIFTESSDL